MSQSPDPQRRRAERAATSLGRLLAIAAEALMPPSRPASDAEKARLHLWSNRAGQDRGETFFIAALVTFTMLGLSLGAVWTPCAGPVLASILTLIATEPPGISTAVLLLAYSTGAAIPMLAIAYGGQAAASHVRSISRHAHRVQQAFGVVVIAVALAMLLEVDGQVTAWLSQFYPSGFGGL